jgi:NADH-quinone oxidoreductase subunit B
MFRTDHPYITTKLESAIGWCRKYSLYPYPFVTACCGMEYMAVSCAHYDTDRFGAALPRFTPRQADLLWVVGTISHKQAPVLLRVYEQMAEPKWVLAFGACASSGGFYDNYATVSGIDKLMPVDMYIPGCPPRPEAVLDALIKLQQRIHNGPQPILPGDPVERRDILAEYALKADGYDLLNKPQAHSAPEAVD